jgi:hypothetical protein
LEWQVVYGATTGASQIWINGAATALALSGTTTIATPPFGRFFVASYFSGVQTVQPAFTMWIDDVAIGPQRIGCDSK